MHTTHTFCASSHQRRQMSGKEKTMCFKAASDISKKLIGQIFYEEAD